MKTWLKAAAIRAVKTFAQGAIAAIGSSAIYLGDVNWLLVISAGVFAAILSMLTSLAGIPEADGGQSIVAIAEDK